MGPVLCLEADILRAAVLGPPQILAVGPKVQGPHVRGLRGAHGHWGTVAPEVQEAGVHMGAVHGGPIGGAGVPYTIKGLLRPGGPEP